jgi:primosomal protein N' (replication factor Y)
LVPEIALTPQTLARFEKRFGQVGIMHSALTDKQRLQTWLRCRDGELNILIGTRSAVFTPFKRLELIIVDEEHDSSYKQQEGLRYSARDLTAKRAHSLGIPLVLGSATPSLESLYNVSRQRYSRLKLPSRAGGASMPSYHLVDLRGLTLHEGFSRTLIDVIRRHLANEGQVLVYLNRRGFAPTLLCRSCGWQYQCSDCDAKLTLHRAPDQMICHHCLLKFEVPKECGHCGQSDLLPVGLGTQRAEDAVEAIFPDVPVYRVDRDTTRTNRQLGEQLDKINQGAPCIMVGTQMLAKGHHFPSVTLVVVLNADSGFLSPDFRAPERTAQLIVQVAGRAGRAERSGEVWIQSYQPDNPVLKRLIDEGYTGFAEAELKTREDAGLPPILPMAMLRAESQDGRMALDFLQNCKRSLNNMGQNRVEVMGPIPAPMARVANRYRYQLMLIAPNRSHLHQLLQGLGRPKAPAQLRWSIDVDPYDAL